MDETTPDSRAKPEGVMDCEIWVKVGDPAPTDPDQLQFLGTDTRTPYVATYAAKRPVKSHTTCCAGSTPKASKALRAKPSAPPSQATPAMPESTGMALREKSL
jgi:hypothetical protein